MVFCSTLSIKQIFSSTAPNSNPNPCLTLPSPPPQALRLSCAFVRQFDGVVSPKPHLSLGRPSPSRDLPSDSPPDPRTLALDRGPPHLHARSPVHPPGLRGHAGHCVLPYAGCSQSQEFSRGKALGLK